jgi:hypothetical protein
VYLAKVVAPPGQHLQPGQVGLDHLVVPAQREDQRDIDAPPFADHRLDGRYAFGSGRDLDEEVWRGDSLVQGARSRDGGLGVSGELRRHLDRHEPVGTAAGVESASQHSECLRNVVEDEIPVRVRRRPSCRGERRELSVVGIGAFDRLSEDRWVCGHTAHTVVDEPRQCAIAQVRAGQIVQPRALTLLVVEPLQFGHLCLQVNSARTRGPPARTWAHSARVEGDVTKNAQTTIECHCAQRVAYRPAHGKVVCGVHSATAAEADEPVRNN